MKQLKTIDQLKELFSILKGIDVALLYGSFGRKDATPNSDIDVQILIDETFNVKELIQQLKSIFKTEILSVFEVQMRNKVVVYFNSQPKLEIGICKQLSEVNRNYLGSEITNIEQSILYEKSPAKYEIRTYLHQLVSDYNSSKTDMVKQTEIANLIDKFLYEFENASGFHRRSDGYKFYFFYNIALQVAIQLNHLAKGESKFNFLPKNFIANTLTKAEQKTFYDLKGTLFLPEANALKRKLLDFFYSSIQDLIINDKLNELRHFCETVYNRDFLWNFRDINLHNAKIRKGVIFRTATMTLFQNENFFGDFLTENKIKTVIDLRADKELTESNYTEASLQKFVWIHTPFDPWNQSIEFQATHHQGNNIEIAYRFFAIECKPSIKAAFEAILQAPNATAIHCYAGKDRTGIIISMIHLLSGAEMEIVYNDYLATESDTKKEYLDIIIDIIEKHGGIENYLISSGLSENQILQLKQRLLN